MSQINYWETLKTQKYLRDAKIQLKLFLNIPSTIKAELSVCKVMDIITHLTSANYAQHDGQKT
jgi:uncharacterized protein YeeX (DUF496 family)